MLEQTSQAKFFRAYVLSKPYVVRKALWPSVVGKSGASDFTGDPQGFTDDDRSAAAEKLLTQGFKLDQEIDIFGFDPYTTMIDRINTGVMWVWPGTNQGSDGSIPAGSHGLPVPPGAIKTSLELADYPLDPDPAPETENPAPPAPRIANPVGTIFQSVSDPNTPGGVGSLFRDIANDGYNINETWSGTASGHTGTFRKELRMAGMMKCWELIDTKLVSLAA